MTNQNVIVNSHADVCGKRFPVTRLLWLVLFAAAISLPGCTQSAGQPKERAVKKKASTGEYKESRKPIRIIFTDVPEVPERIQGPSPPLPKMTKEKKKASK